MAVEAINFRVYRGTAPSPRFTRTKNGSCAGWTVRFTARLTPEAPDPPALDILATVDDPGSGSSPAVFVVAFTRLITLGLKKAKYAVSLERVDAGAEEMLAIGTMDVVYDIRNAR